MSLRIFSGFQSDLAVSFTGLTPGQIAQLRKKAIVRPEKTNQGFCYSFVDILTMKLVRQLIVNGARLKNIQKAHDYLAKVDPDKSLLHYKLYIWVENDDILYLGDDESELNAFVSTAQLGQMIIRDVVSVIPIGPQLEKVRREVIELDASLHEAANTDLSNLIPFDEVRRRYAGT